jgi:hypothetical protein
LPLPPDLRTPGFHEVRMTVREVIERFPRC